MDKAQQEEACRPDMPDDASCACQPCTYVGRGVIQDALEVILDPPPYMTFVRCSTDTLTPESLSEVPADCDHHCKPPHTAGDPQTSTDEYDV